MHVFSNASIPILYAAAMLVAAVTAPFLGRAYDRRGRAVVVVAFAISAVFAPLVFLGGFLPALIGTLLWGLGMAAQDALLPSVIARSAPPDRRATALGTFDAVYGVAWFAGSAAMGALYDRSIVGLVALSLFLQICCGLPLLVLAFRRT